MCDRIAGEILISFSSTDLAANLLVTNIRRGLFPQIRIIESLADRLERINLPIRDDIKLEAYRLSVPIGQEEYQINHIQNFHKASTAELFLGRSMSFHTHSDIFLKKHYGLQSVPHSITSINTNITPSIGVIELTETHHAYKNMLGWSKKHEENFGAYRPYGSNRRILILDTGTDSSVGNIILQRNFVDPNNPFDASDDNGHGTVVAKIIRDLSPSAEIIVFKVADKKGRASEWDTLAALAAKVDADIINISLAFGLPNTSCPVCGRESQSSRSAVFESTLAHLNEQDKKPLVVSAAGNNKKSELAFPARFNDVIAVESVDGSGNLSEFTNRSNINQDGEEHQNVFVVPGGQRNQEGKITEFVATSSNGNQYYGTSFSTAYASGVLAAIWSNPFYFAENSSQIVQLIRENTNKDLPNFEKSLHGNGLMRLL